MKGTGRVFQSRSGRCAERLLARTSTPWNRLCAGADTARADVGQTVRPSCLRTANERGARRAAQAQASARRLSGKRVSGPSPRWDNPAARQCGQL